MWQTHDVDTLIDQRDQLRTERDELQQLWQAETRKADEMRRQRDEVAKELSRMLHVFDRGLQSDTVGRKVCDDARRILAQYDKDGDA